MAAFSYQQQNPFLLDPAYLPSTPIGMPFITPQVEKNASPGFPYCFSSESIPEASTTDNATYESSCSLGSGIKVGGTESQMDHSAVFVEPRPQAPMEKKRKSGYRTCMSPSQSRDIKERKSRKQRRPNCGLKGKEEKSKDEVNNETKACEEPPAGYIHVRARRGQATDSHSLAERVRREKISVRMKALQGLVPGCDKVVGKALMLDEIINYVQSLQNQVEFLSMKLASVNPMLYDFAVDFDDCVNRPEKFGSIVEPLPSIHQCPHILPQVLGEATSNNQSVNAPMLHQLHGQGPITFSQDNTTYLMQADEHRQGFFVNQAGFSNMCSFQ